MSLFRITKVESLRKKQVCMPDSCLLYSLICNMGVRSFARLVSEESSTCSQAICNTSESPKLGLAHGAEGTISLGPCDRVNMIKFSQWAHTKSYNGIARDWYAATILVPGSKCDRERKGNPYLLREPPKSSVTPWTTFSLGLDHVAALQSSMLRKTKQTDSSQHV